MSTQRPDRVIGLSQRDVLNEHLSVHQGLRHSPFADCNAVYPFLVVEAKSEKAGSGWESIECQTAFPIMTLVKLQQQVTDVRGISINPLVWFLANRGDEWRVYGSIAQASKIVCGSSQAASENPVSNHTNSL